MRQGRQVSGGVSLVMICCALCLCMFAVLTYTAANQERILAEVTAQRAAEYYEADRRAVEWVASRMAAMDMEQVSEGLGISVSIPAGETQRLEVTLQREDDHYRIVRWQLVYSGAWSADDTIELWDGQDTLELWDGGKVLNGE